MGELRAYVLPPGALRGLLTPGRRELLEELVRAELPPSPPPRPLGPIWSRVPGTSVVRPDDPTPADLDLLLDGAEVPPGRARAAWRLVEAVAAGTATATVRTRTDRPTGLAPLGLPVPAADGLEVGSWTLAEAAAHPGLQVGLAGAADRLPPGPGAGEVVVFWEATAPR